MYLRKSETAENMPGRCVVQRGGPFLGCLRGLCTAWYHALSRNMQWTCRLPPGMRCGMRMLFGMHGMRGKEVADSRTYASLVYI